MLFPLLMKNSCLTVVAGAYGTDYFVTLAALENRKQRTEKEGEKKRKNKKKEKEREKGGAWRIWAVSMVTISLSQPSRTVSLSSAMGGSRMRLQSVEQFPFQACPCILYALPPQICPEIQPYRCLCLLSFRSCLLANTECHLQKNTWQCHRSDE